MTLGLSFSFWYVLQFVSFQNADQRPATGVQSCISFGVFRSLTQKNQYVLRIPANSYLTIQGPAEGLYREKGSKFLAFAWPVHNEQDIREHLTGLKKKYFDARHHCFAWMLGPDKDRFRAFDDGEPNHSAGDPILGQIRSKGLTNVLVVVVRYFGGVKLGVGGLISAYKAATEDALNNAIVIEKEVVERLSIEFEYGATPDVMRMIKEFELIIIRQDFTDVCNLVVDVKISMKQELHKKFALLKSLGYKIDF